MTAPANHLWLSDTVIPSGHRRALKRVLLDLEPPLLQPQVFDGLLEAQFGSAGLQQRIATFRRLLSTLNETRFEILQTVLRFLRVVVEAQEQREVRPAVPAHPRFPLPPG